MRKILMFGYRPPPVFGPGVAYENLLRSEFVRHFDVTFINLSVVQSIRELEKFQPGKLLKLAKFFLLELWYLLTRRFDLCCYPIAYNRRAFQKDRVLIGLARLFRVPVVLWAHGTGARRFRETCPKEFDRVVASARAVLVLANCLRAEFPTSRVYTVTLGIEPLTIPSLPRDGRTLLYLSSLVKAKGIFDLLEAMPAILKGGPVRLVVAGEWFKPEEQAAAEQFIREHNLAGAIEFVGPVAGDHKWRLLAGADIFVFPPHSETEAFGIVLLEAMQAGLPIVATRGGARNEIIIDGVNGLLAEEKNPSDLAVKILQLLNDVKLRKQVGETNRQAFDTQYTHEHYGRRMMAVFEELTHE